MILLVGFYEDAQRSRTREFAECLRRNCDNDRIERIVVFGEGTANAGELRRRWPVLGDPKVQFVDHGRRLRFAELFDFANRHCPGAVVCIANADIYFDESLALLDARPLADQLLCLSRWDDDGHGTLRHLDRPDSQDAWIFHAPAPVLQCDFALGVPGCDNRLAYEAERAGLRVNNPSRSLRACHLHRSGVRRYTPRNRVAGPNRMVPASFLDTGDESGGWPSDSAFPSHRTRRLESAIRTRHEALLALLAPHLGDTVPAPLRQELWNALAQQEEARLRPPPPPLAAVAFREAMGYTVARLGLGVSTHNNDPRPLVSVPDELIDLDFTQVVANRATPVQVEFRTAGRLFVLAAPGWEGYAPAASFLNDAGWKEPISPLRARDGTTFDIWSLVADAGERFVAPTQVMLAAADLSRLK